MPTSISPARQRKNRTRQRWAFLQWVLYLWLLGLQSTLGQNGTSYFVYPDNEGGSSGYSSRPILSVIEQPTSKTATLTTNGDAGNHPLYQAKSTSDLHAVYSRPAAFTQEAPPSITVQPVSRTVCSAKGVQFSVKADGTDLIYAWQYYDNTQEKWVMIGPGQTLFRGFTTNTVTVSDDTLSNEQYQVQIRAVVSNGYGSVNSQAATFTKLATTIVITQQPTGKIACSSIGLDYRVQVKQEENLSYNWEFNDGKGWASIIADTNKYKGYNTGVLTIRIEEPTGRRYRVEVNNGNCPIYSDSVAFTKLRAIVITQQPISQTVCSGDGKGLKYSVQADGYDLGYEWEFKDPTMTKWMSFSNFSDTYPDYTTPTLTASGVETPGRKYRVKIINDCGIVYSDSVTFGLPASKITQQPRSRTACSANNNGLTYTVVVESTGALTYEWEFKDPNADKWTSLGGQYAYLYPGYDSPTLTTNGTEANGRLYRVNITDKCGNTLQSQSATFILATTPPEITQQPQSRTACSANNNGLTYTVVVESTGAVAYEWEFKDPDMDKWKPLSEFAAYYPGYNTASLTTNGVETTGRQYRVSINNGCAYSNPATFTLAPTPTITQQPQSRTACSGKGLTYSVRADGKDLTYEWEFKNRNDSKWYSLSDYASAYPGYNAAVLTTNGDEGNGRQYRAKISYGYCTVYSDSAVFTQIQCTPTLTNFSAAPASAITGQPIEFTATVGGTTEPYTYTLTNGAGSTQTGTTSGSSFSQRLTAQGTGPQTYTLTIGSSPYTVTATTVVTVASFAITDFKAFANPVEAGQSVEFTATFEGLTDTDLYRYTLTNGQELVPLTGNFRGSSFKESITARGTGIQSFTLVVDTRDKGRATATISVTVIGQDVGQERFVIVGVKDVNCETISENQRQLRFTPQYEGVSSEPISFSVVNELLPTTQPGPYNLRLYIDNPIITMVARQGNAETKYSYNWLANCLSTLPNSFTLAGAQMVDCQLEDASGSKRYKVSLQPQYTGQSNTQPVSFSVVNELSPTTAPGPYTLRLWGDNPTITLVANQGNAEAKYSYNWLANCPSTSPNSFTLTGAQMVNCQLEDASGSKRYKISLQPQYAGQDNTRPISFSVVNELSPTTAPGPYTLRLWGDNPTITLVANQNNAQARYNFNWLAGCQASGSARRAVAEEISSMQVRLWGNPITNHQIKVEVKGVEGQTLDLTLTDLNGRPLTSERIERSALVEQFNLRSSPAWGNTLLLKVHAVSPTGIQQQIVKVIQD